MANNTKGRPKQQRPSTYRSISYNHMATGKTYKPAPKGANKGVDGIDRAKIDALAEERRIARLSADVWDE